MGMSSAAITAAILRGRFTARTGARLSYRKALMGTTALTVIPRGQL